MGRRKQGREGGRGGAYLDDTVKIVIEQNMEGEREGGREEGREKGREGRTLMMLVKLSSSRMMEAASFETSVPVTPMAIPTSACRL